MPPDMKNPAAGTTGFRDKDLVGRINREHSQAADQNQLVARVRKSAREEYRISVRRFADGTRKCDIRVWELDPKGAWRPTPRNIVISAGAIPALVHGLTEAGERL
jgi:hypothetical protein